MIGEKHELKVEDDSKGNNAKRPRHGHGCLSPKDKELPPVSEYVCLSDHSDIVLSVRLYMDDSYGCIVGGDVYVAIRERPAYRE